jgi:hypothetical protein
VALRQDAPDFRPQRQECPAAPEKRCTVSMPEIRGAEATPDMSA